MAAGTYEDFAEAFRRKLLREIEDRPPVSLDRRTPGEFAQVHDEGRFAKQEGDGI